MFFRELQGLDYHETLKNLVCNSLLITARSHEEFCDIFDMVEMMAKCQELLVDRGGMAHFFTAIGHGLYTSRQGSECSVKYGQNFLSLIKPMRLFAECKVQIETCDVLTMLDSQDYLLNAGPRHEVNIHIHNDHQTISLEDLRSFMECKVQTEDCHVLMKVDAHDHSPDAETQHKVDIQIYDDHPHISLEDTHSFVQHKVQRDLDAQGKLPPIHYNRTLEPGQPVALDQSYSAVIPQHNEQFNLACMVGL